MLTDIESIFIFDRTMNLGISHVDYIYRLSEDIQIC